eukprot:4099831-Amphidinium_carterae.3
MTNLVPTAANVLVYDSKEELNTTPKSMAMHRAREQSVQDLQNLSPAKDSLLRSSHSYDSAQSNAIVHELLLYAPTKSLPLTRLGLDHQLASSSSTQRSPCEAKALFHFSRPI